MARADLISGFKTIPGVSLRGSFFRAIPLVHISSPLSAVGSLARGGRYNAAGGFEAFYIARSPDTTLYELQVISPRSAPTRTKPLITFTIEVDLQAVVDLTSRANVHALGLTPADLIVEWKAVLIAGGVPITHDIGSAARDAGVEAIIVPSARQPGATNLVIFPDRLRHGSSVRIDPPDGFPPGTRLVISGP
jgi:RES domain-containing protein